MTQVIKIISPTQNAGAIIAKAAKAAGILFIILSSLSVSSQTVNNKYLSHLTLHPTATTQQKGCFNAPALYPKPYTVFLAKSFPVIESNLSQVLYKMEDGESLDCELLFSENKNPMPLSNIKSKKNTKTKTGPKLNYKL